MYKKVVLITGASSGFGKICAKFLNQRDYKVYGTGRENDCSGGDITHLTVETADGGKTWKKEKIIEMIEREDGDEFWSYHYDNREIDDRTRIIVEVVDDPDGKYLRTKRDETEENNLLELPIYHYDSDSSKNMWVRC